MIVTKTKRKIIITKFEVAKLERFRPVEIRLPANVRRITGILMTASGNKGFGTISFQANDSTDVFHVAQIIEDGIDVSDEALLNVEDPQFDSDRAWVTGNVPKLREVNVEGDTSIINAWFKSESFDQPFAVRIYIACELSEELDEVTPDESKEQRERKAAELEPMEIHI
jgi:hypothetical protein